MSSCDFVSAAALGGMPPPGPKAFFLDESSAPSELNLSRTQVRARLALRQPANSSSRKSLVTQAARLALRKSRQICCVTSSLQLARNRPSPGGKDVCDDGHVATLGAMIRRRLLLTRFQGTDEGEVKEYLGCEVIRDRAARTGKMVQAGCAERVLRTFGMWDCNPVLTSMDPNVRLTKRDSPEVVDPRLHRRMRSIVGCLSYLVNMTQRSGAM